MSEENLDELVATDAGSGEVANTRQVINLETDNFSKLLGGLDILSKVCADAHIEKGQICQMTDRRSAIYKLDLSSVLGEASLLLSNIEGKVALLEPFRKQNVEMELVIDDGQTDPNMKFYFFQDELTKIRFTKALERFMSNEYIPEEEFQNRLNIADEEPIFSYEMSKFLIERLVALAKGMGASVIMVEFGEESADFTVASGDQNVTTLGKLVTVDLNRGVSGTCAFPILPFIIGVDSLTLECYSRGNGDSLLLKISASNDGIPIEIWAISNLVSGDIADDE
ncbi:MAG: hypothetical protein KAS32_17225 [Candidatus Peribacteraceae bacterium]|nr:hypothetical protein [Candidatus Peribacteraceae bacterium]